MKLNLNNNEKKIITASQEDIAQLAGAVSDILMPGDWWFLNGDLGAGKTSLVKEISIHYRVQNFFTSPTFSILNSEKAMNEINGIEKLVHLDLYRLKSGKELCYIGLEEEFNAKNSVAIFEWASVLEEDDWDYFFKFTRCSKPKRILNTQIENFENKRKYEFILSL